MTVISNKLDNADLEALFDLSLAPEAGQQVDAKTGKPWEEIRCQKCKGGGKFIGYKGRPIGDCFACKGSGVRREAVEDATAKIDVSAIRKAFETAVRRGLKNPKISITPFKFSRAPDTGKNPGAIYVKAGDEYIGKITGNEFWSARACTQKHIEDMLEIAKDPKAAAERHGILTGRCGKCGLKLTDPESVARGIGPICAKNFGW
jgi:Zn-finger protein